MNIYDISKITGVSIATVSRVINGSGKVSAKTRQKVTDAIELYGYVPGKSSRRKRTWHVGVLCSDIHRNFLWQLMKKFGNTSVIPDVMLCKSTALSLKSALERFSEAGTDVLVIDGMCISGYDDSEAVIKAFAENTPVIIAGDCIECRNVYCIVCPADTVISEVTLSHIKCGITDILYIFRQTSRFLMESLESYKSAFETGGLPESSDRARLCPGGYDDAFSYISQIISDGRVPELVIASDSELAAGALNAAVNAGISIPDHMEIITIDSSDIPSHMNPSVTSIDCLEEKLCSQIISMISALIHGENIPARTVFTPVLRKMDSTL